VTPDSTPPNPDADASKSPLVRLEHAVESAVEEAIALTERSLVQRFGRHCVRALRFALAAIWTALVVAFFTFGLLFLVTRYALLPRADQARSWLEREASSELGRPVKIGRIDAGWRGFSPSLTLADVRILVSDGQTGLVLPQLEATISWWSVPRGGLRLTSLSVLAPELTVQRLPAGRWQIAGFTLDPAARSSDDGRALDWLLEQRNVAIRNARINYVDASAEVGPPLVLPLTDVNLVLHRGLASHQFALQARPPTDYAGVIDVRGAFHYPWSERGSNLALWTGRVFAQMEFVDLARLDAVTRLLPAGVEVARAQGALRAWLDFENLQSTRFVADLALADVSVRLASDLEPLQLASVQGRVAQRAWGDALEGGEELTLTRLALAPVAAAKVADIGDDSAMGNSTTALAPLDLLLRTTRSAGRDGTAQPQRGEFEANALALQDLSALAAHVPIAANVRDLVAKYALRGKLSNLRLTWLGDAAHPERFSIRTRFDALAANAQPATPERDDAGRPRIGVPGIENLSGSLEATQAGGTLTINARNAGLDLPGLYAEPLRFTTLAALVHFDLQPAFALRIDNLGASNADLRLALNGTYRRAAPRLAGRDPGPGEVDLNARVQRLAADRVHAYVPLVAAEPLRQWLQHALLGGTAADAIARIRGNLAEFPFADPKRGEFRVALDVRDLTLDYLPVALRASAADSRPPWPMVSGLNGRLVFDRHAMNFTGSEGSLFSTRLAAIHVRIPDVASRDAHLLIDANGHGPLADPLRYVQTSPVGALLGNSLAVANGSGPAVLDLALDIPLRHARDTTVKGIVTFANNDLALMPQLPPLAKLNGKLQFNEHGFALDHVDGAFIGGQSMFNAVLDSDGAQVVSATGTVSVAGIARAYDSPLVQRFLQHASGQTRYSARLRLKEKRSELHVESDLSGLAFDLPAPLAKGVSELWPTQFDLLPVRPGSVALPPPTAATPAANTVAPTVANSAAVTSAASIPAAPAAAALRDTMRLRAGSALELTLERVRDTAEAPARIERGVISIGSSDKSTSLNLSGSAAGTDTPPAATTSTASATSVGTPDSGLLLNIVLPRLDVDRWRELVDLPGADRGNTDVHDMMPDYLAVRVGQLIVAGKPLANVVFGATRSREQGADVWQGNIVSDHATGALAWYAARTGAPARVTARLVRLAIPASQQDTVATVLDAPTGDVPSIDIVADDFELGARKLGRLELAATSNGSGANAAWQLQKLEIANPDGRMSASGQWRRDPGDNTHSSGRQMALKLQIEFANAGNLLARFGVGDAIRGAQGKLEGTVQWRGSPFTIDYPTLTGSLKLNCASGQFLKAGAGGAGRLLSVMSLQALPRRISLDFRDVFSEGFAFDTITATADVEAGVLSSKDFRMRGPNATVLLDGSTDLRNETQNLRVLVLPDVNAGSASLVYALLANPAIGLGTFLAQLLLREPLAKAFSFEYDVSGSWTEPQVKRREKPPPEKPEAIR